MKSFAHIAIVSGVVLTVCSPMPASAQVGQRSYQGLFGGSGYDPNVHHSLEFGFTLTEAYDDDAPGEFFGNPSELLVSGYSTMLEGTGEYRWRPGRTEIGASATSVMRYYSATEEFRSTAFVGAAGVSAQLTPSSKIFLNQTVNYSPSYLYNLFPFNPVIDPGDAPPSGEDYQVIDIASYTYNTDLSLSHRLSARSSFTVTANHSYTDFGDDQTLFFDLRSTGIRGDFTRSFSRRLSMLAGYYFRAGDYSESPDTTEHGVEVGLDYTRPLSSTRSAIFGFRVGGSNVEGAQLEGATGTETVSYSLMSGSVNAGYQFGRSWRADGFYRRAIDYVPGFPDPVLTDGLTASVSGGLTPRLELSTSVGYSNGDSAFYQQKLPFDTFTVNANLRYGLSKTVAVYFEYLYYKYRFEDRTTMPEGVPAGLERNGVRAGLTLWMPAFRK